MRSTAAGMRAPASRGFAPAALESEDVLNVAGPQPGQLAKERGQATSKRPRFITFVQAVTKSLTNFSLASALP
jgi:hypothetical protein